MTPVRSCVGCGGRERQSALLRFVATADGLRPDGGKRSAGRGAYLHRDRACWTAFVRRRGAVRSLRQSPARAERERLVSSLEAMCGAA